MQRTQVAETVAVQPPSRFRVFTSLRYPSYRYYWLGMVSAVTGLQIMTVAQAWLVYDLTRSPAALGLVSASQAVPAILLNMFGGVVADRVDRRRLLLFTQSSNALVALAVAVLLSTHQIAVWQLVIAAALAGALQAFDLPARMALVPQLVERRDLTNAIALQSMVWQGTRIIGPAIGGLLISVLSIDACYYVTAAAMGVMVISMVKVRVLSARPAPSQGHIGHNMAEGVAYVLKTPIFAILIGMTFLDTMFGMSFIILLPVFAREILQIDSTGYGLLFGISGVGSLLGTTTVAYLGNYAHKGRLLLTGATLFGISLVGFALSPFFYLSLIILLFAGIMNSLYMTTVNTSLQSLVPDELRGRVMGIYSLAYGLLPLGGMIAGIIAALASAPIAVAFGGSVVAVMAVSVALKLPQVRNL